MTCRSETNLLNFAWPYSIDSVKLYLGSQKGSRYDEILLVVPEGTDRCEEVGQVAAESETDDSALFFIKIFLALDKHPKAAIQGNSVYLAKSK